MTREEATTLLKKLRTFHNGTYAKAIDMAISALEREDKWLNDFANNVPSDLISRADAVKAVCDKCPISFKEKCEWKDNGHCSMKVALEALPSAVCDDCIWHVCNYNKVDWDAPSAEAVSREFYEDAIKANHGLARELANLKQEFKSAEATCAACADKALCIMADDGNWKACKDYRPSADRPMGEWSEEDTLGLHHCYSCGFGVLYNTYRFCPKCGARMTPYKGGEDDGKD